MVHTTRVHRADPLDRAGHTVGARPHRRPHRVARTSPSLMQPARRSEQGRPCHRRTTPQPHHEPPHTPTLKPELARPMTPRGTSKHSNRTFHDRLVDLFYTRVFFRQGRHVTRKRVLSKTVTSRSGPHGCLTFCPPRGVRGGLSVRRVTMDVFERLLRRARTLETLRRPRSSRFDDVHGLRVLRTGRESVPLALPHVGAIFCGVNQ
jgi:hypothetical protein